MIAAQNNLTLDRGSDWIKVLTIRDANGDPVDLAPAVQGVAQVETCTLSGSVSSSGNVTAAFVSELGDATVSVPLLAGETLAVAAARIASALNNRKDFSLHWTASSVSNAILATAKEPDGNDATVNLSVLGGTTGITDVTTSTNTTAGKAQVFGEFSFSGQLRQRHGSRHLGDFSFNIIGNGSSGQVRIRFPEFLSYRLSADGAYVYDWVLYRNGVRTRAVRGRVDIRGDISVNGSTTYFPAPSAPGVVWGAIGGTLSDQADLQAALDAAGGFPTWGSITGNLADQTDLGDLAGQDSVSSAQISDKSTGGNGAADGGKVVAFSAGGDAYFTSAVGITSQTDPARQAAFYHIGNSPTLGLGISNIGSAGQGSLLFPEVSGTVNWTLPPASGTLVTGAGSGVTSASSFRTALGLGSLATASSITSSQVSDASQGGNGAPDSGKLAKFNASGALKATHYVEVWDNSPPGGNPYLIGIVSQGGIQSIQFNQDAFTGNLASPILSDTVFWFLPPSSGSVSLMDRILTDSPTTGFTIDSAPYINQLHYWTPSGTLASGALLLPSPEQSLDGQSVKVFTTQTITSFTVSVDGTGTITGPATTTIAANTSIEFMCVVLPGDSTSTWVRLR